MTNWFKCSGESVFRRHTRVAWILAIVVAALGGSVSFECLVMGQPAANGSQNQREIVDPCLGTRWRWQPDAEHPGWPARLVLVEAQGGRNAIVDGQVVILGPHQAIADRRSAIPVPQIAIRAGDRVELEQDNGLVHARLLALALEPAASGQALKVRLIGGLRAGSMPGGFMPAGQMPGASISGGASFNGPAASAVALEPGHARWVAWEKGAR